MKPLTLEQFLDLPWSDNVRHKLRTAVADREEVVMIAWDNAGKLSASVFTAMPDVMPDNTKAFWVKTAAPASSGLSKTMQAVQLVQAEGLTPYAAAKQVGINASAVHRALARREGRDVCPHCNQVIKDPAGLPASASQPKPSPAPSA